MGLLDQYSPEQMEQMPWDQLYQLRLKAGEDQALQQQIAPYEHRAYAREQVAENPFLAPVYAVMPAGYQAAKVAGLLGSDGMTTKPSLTQLQQGLLGVGDGLQQWWKKKGI